MLQYIFVFYGADSRAAAQNTLVWAIQHLWLLAERAMEHVEHFERLHSWLTVHARVHRPSTANSVKNWLGSVLPWDILREFACSTANDHVVAMLLWLGFAILTYRAVIWVWVFWYYFCLWDLYGRHPHKRSDLLQTALLLSIWFCFKCFFVSLFMFQLILSRRCNTPTFFTLRFFCYLGLLIFVMCCCALSCRSRASSSTKVGFRLVWMNFWSLEWLANLEIVGS